ELPRMNTNEVFGAVQETISENPLDGRLTRELQMAERLKELFPGPPRIHPLDGGLCAGVFGHLLFLMLG
ncbi:MAG: hypothetical protein MUO50_11560, partial [Longimicrobiales bacterium]|nr:hypothetical protein [Longimicrobiales bacterium]